MTSTRLSLLFALCSVLFALYSLLCSLFYSSPLATSCNRSRWGLLREHKCSAVASSAVASHCPLLMRSSYCLVVTVPLYKEGRAEHRVAEGVRCTTRDLLLQRLSKLSAFIFHLSSFIFALFSVLCTLFSPLTFPDGTSYSFCTGGPCRFGYPLRHST